MVINRLNYEEYFLLYIDGELPVSERQAVELFVAQNADLAGELELLLQTRLECDITALPDKNSLYRHTGCKINETNYYSLLVFFGTIVSYNLLKYFEFFRNNKWNFSQHKSILAVTFFTNSGAFPEFRKEVDCL